MTTAMPIRVLCVFSTLDRGGAEAMCMNLYRHLDRSQVQFDFVKHTDAAGKFEAEIAELGGNVYAAPRFKGYNYIAYRSWWRRHFAAHPEHRIVHIHFFTMANLICPVAKRAGRKTITHAHTSRSGSFLKRVLQHNIGKATDVCFACSEDAGKWLFPNRTFTVLHNAVDAAAFQYDPAVREAVRREYGLTDRLVVGAVGSITAVKNPYETVAIFSELYAREPAARLLWLGGGGMAEEIRGAVSEKGLSDAVTFLGVRPDVSRFLQAMDAYLQPSVFEGLSVAQIEAQAAGLRCYISDTVTREADVTGRCAYLPLGQPQLWADAILSADLEKVDTMQQIIDAGYDIHTTAKWLQAYYLGL